METFEIKMTVRVNANYEGIEEFGVIEMKELIGVQMDEAYVPVLITDIEVSEV